MLEVERPRRRGDRRRRAAPRPHAARADAAARVAGGGVHGADPRRGRVPREDGGMSAPVGVTPRAGSRALGVDRSCGRCARRCWSLVVAVGRWSASALLIAATVATGDDADSRDRLDSAPVDAASAAVSWHSSPWACSACCVISGEYSTGMIRSTLAAVPRRLPVLWAKLGRVRRGDLRAHARRRAFVAFFVGQAIVAQPRADQRSWATPRRCGRSSAPALFLTGVGLLGVALGCLAAQHRRRHRDVRPRSCSCCRCSRRPAAAGADTIDRTCRAQRRDGDRRARRREPGTCSAPWTGVSALLCAYVVRRRRAAAAVMLIATATS